MIQKATLEMAVGPAERAESSMPNQASLPVVKLFQCIRTTPGEPVQPEQLLPDVAKRVRVE